VSTIHPGKLYLSKYSPICSKEDVLGFADFLRRESGLEGVIPVDLNIIYSYFKIPKPKYLTLSKQQGLLLDADQGIIAINSNDPETRQRFSEAHELAEMLFSELSAGIDLSGGWVLKKPGGFSESMKEKLCNQVAANLLMPPNELQPYLQNFGVNFKTAGLVSTDFFVSLSAAMIQLTYISSGHFCVVLWRMKNKPIEIKNQPFATQLKLLDDVNNELPAKKLRVEWSIQSKNGIYIPHNKSTENTTQIYKAWQFGSYTCGEEVMCFDGRRRGLYRSENLPFMHDGERYVLSLIEYLR
jgi:Zn-dependent peptidase ImmA (M78 family)